MSSSKGFRVTVEDLDTGAKQVRTVHSGDYMPIPFAPCYLASSQAYPKSGTHVVTIKGYGPTAAASAGDTDE